MEILTINSNSKNYINCKKKIRNFIICKNAAFKIIVLKGKIS